MKGKLQKIISGVACMAFTLSSMTVPGNLIADAVNLETVANVSTTDSGTLENGLAYEIYEDHVVITGCDRSAEGEIMIPDTIQGLPVTEIGEYAFYRCLALESVTIPESLTELAPLVFGGCDALTEIHVDPENQNYMDIDGILFSKDQQTLVQYPAGKSGQSYTVPEDVTIIGDGAFRGCDSLETILIPDHVTEIGWGAFYSCTSLTAIAIPKSLTSISEHTFGNCSSLTAITIPDSVTNIGDSAFMDCTALTSIIIPENVTEIGVCAFGFCSALDAITILNPDCDIQIAESEERDDFLWVEVENTISKTAVIYGYLDSTAQAYAEEWGNTFVALDGNPVNSEIFWGDADGNGEVEILDVVLMNRVYVGIDQISDEDMKNADVDQDGKITLSDSMNVLKLLVHLLEQNDFPIGQ